jgi:hypothetical protein
VDGARSGTGSYFDAAGASYEVIDELELGLDDLNHETLRSGVLRGRFNRNGGDSSSQAFELSFRACSHLCPRA